MGFCVCISLRRFARLFTAIRCPLPLRRCSRGCDESRHVESPAHLVGMYRRYGGYRGSFPSIWKKSLEFLIPAFLAKLSASSSESAGADINPHHDTTTPHHTPPTWRRASQEAPSVSRHPAIPLTAPLARHLTLRRRRSRPTDPPYPHRRSRRNSLHNHHSSSSKHAAEATVGLRQLPRQCTPRQ